MPATGWHSCPAFGLRCARSPLLQLRRGPGILDCGVGGTDDVRFCHFPQRLAVGAVSTRSPVLGAVCSGPFRGPGMAGVWVARGCLSVLQGPACQQGSGNRLGPCAVPFKAPTALPSETDQEAAADSLYLSTASPELSLKARDKRCPLALMSLPGRSECPPPWSQSPHQEVGAGHSMLQCWLGQRESQTQSWDQSGQGACLTHS